MFEKDEPSVEIILEISFEDNSTFVIEFPDEL